MSVDSTGGSSETMRRSARRQTARARCSAAPPGLPPARMNRRSGGTSSSKRSIRASSRATSASAIAALVTRSAILAAGSARRAPTANRSRWMLRELVVEIAVADRRSRDAEAGVQLIDLAVRVDAGVVLADARAVEQRRLPRITGTRVDFHVGAIIRCLFRGPRRSRRSRCRHRPTAAASASGCSPGIAATDAICRGARPATRTTSSCPRSCCSRPRSTACCRNTTNGW